MAIMEGTKLGDILIGTLWSDLILRGGDDIFYGDAKASVTEGSVTVSGADDLLSGGAGNDTLYECAITLSIRSVGLTRSWDGAIEARAQSMTNSWPGGAPSRDSPHRES
jgi:Ca2+-binding RTX toxin-like protein